METYEEEMLTNFGASQFTNWTVDNRYVTHNFEVVLSVSELRVSLLVPTAKPCLAVDCEGGIRRLRTSPSN